MREKQPTLTGRALVVFGVGLFSFFFFPPFSLLSSFLFLLFSLLLGPIEEEKEQERGSQKERPARRDICKSALRSEVQREGCAEANRASKAAGWVVFRLSGPRNWLGR